MNSSVPFSEAAGEPSGVDIECFFAICFCMLDMHDARRSTRFKVNPVSRSSLIVLKTARLADSSSMMSDGETSSTDTDNSAGRLFAPLERVSRAPALLRFDQVACISDRLMGSKEWRKDECEGVGIFYYHIAIFENI